MSRCPLCEHEQERGAACDVCGRRLAGEEALAASEPSLEGLEGTRHAAVAAPAAAPEPWLEATLQARVTVEVAPLDVERTSGDGQRTEQGGGPVRCRYCGEIVPGGEAFCLRCGMKADGRASAPAVAAPAPVRCRQCGASAEGARCPACGVRLPEGG